MPQISANILAEALQDEYKVRVTYRKVLERFGDIRPFSNIVESEQRHIAALLALFDKYGIQVPEDDWPSRIEIPDRVLTACQTGGVDAEIEHAKMYDRLLAATHDYPDVQIVLTNLQLSSAESHLPAFQRCVIKRRAPDPVEYALRSATKKYHNKALTMVAEWQNVIEYLCAGTRRFQPVPVANLTTCR